MNMIRPPAVAGLFYPADSAQLAHLIRSMLSQASPFARAFKAMIVPHAGYRYSGPIAATAYKQLESRKNSLSRIILLGPSHHVYFKGIAYSSANTFQTPLGDVKVDMETLDRISGRTSVIELPAAHVKEHCLEVQLPFLQIVLNRFAIVPLLVGETRDTDIADMLRECWGGDETLIVISSDLSHYHDYPTAMRMDALTSTAITTMDASLIDGEHACGYRPIRGLLHLARERGLQAEALDVRNSGDTEGLRDRVVGYGAFLFH